MIHIGGTKLVFKKDILGIFKCESTKPDKSGMVCESVCEPPYKSLVLVDMNGKQKMYLTSLSVRTLAERLKKGNIDVNAELK